MLARPCALLLASTTTILAACAPSPTHPVATPREGAQPAAPLAAAHASSSPSPTPNVPVAPPATLALPAGCGPRGRAIACNPLTNAGCDAARGEACDDDEHGAFKCYPPPNVVKEGGDCNIVEGPSCAPRLGCSGVSDRDPDGECARYCCADTDCARGERCAALEAATGTLGFCE